MTAHRTVRAATQEVLERAGTLHTPYGQLAMNLARRIDAGEAGSAHAQLARELRAALAEALRTPGSAADPVDELAKRRAKRRKQASS